ncbi:MAG: DUF2812 domain-containing protein [Clostridiales bacterium]|nr:DUF2812 domain-containing protein [Clostridiales bacterium]
MNEKMQEFEHRQAKADKKLLTKATIFLDPAEEAATLDVMAEMGLILDKYSYWDSISFKKGKPVRVHHVLDYRWFKTPEEYMSYIGKRSVRGWTHIAGTTRSGRQYFACDVDSDGNPLGKEEDILFPRAEALKGRRKRFITQVLSLTLVLLAYLAALFAMFGFSWEIFGFSADLSGLSGVDLLYAVLPELPFWLFKVIPFFLLLGFWVYYIVDIFRIRKLIYAEAVKNVSKKTKKSEAAAEAEGEAVSARSIKRLGDE